MKINSRATTPEEAIDCTYIFSESPFWFYKSNLETLHEIGLNVAKALKHPTRNEYFMIAGLSPSEFKDKNPWVFINEESHKELQGLLESKNQAQEEFELLSKHLQNIALKGHQWNQKQRR